MSVPKPIWSPPSELVAKTEMTALGREVGAEDYDELWRWSVEDIGRFWSTLWQRFDVAADGDASTALVSGKMPGARWFPDVALSFPEHIFRDRDPAATAVQFASELRPVQRWTWAEMAEHTARIRAGLRNMGVERGDRVVGYLPNIPETLAAFLAVSSLGATWSCCSPDFGIRTVVDRFAQIEPKVLLAVDGYRYGGKDFECRALVSELRAALPTVERTVCLPYLGHDGDWDDAFPPSCEPLSFERVAFDHPLWIVYSSGTTGLPKGIVHGHGGPLLEHLKMWRLQHDVKADDRVFWSTTTGWIMWNILVGALLSPVSITLYDGNPGYPDVDRLWDIAEQTESTVFGTGAAYLHTCMKDGCSPRRTRDLSSLRQIGSTGSPLAPEAYAWVRDHVREDVWLVSASGGTDVAGAFVGGSPLVPVYPGELQARSLGVAVEAWDDEGRPVIDEVGELVVTKPMPSMPVRLWNDPGHVRYREAYFSTFPGVWRHGDWIKITSRGSAIVYGRSDSTINRGGIRIGTAEIYAAVLAADEVVDALAVDTLPQVGIGQGRLWLFVVLADSVELAPELADDLRRRIRCDCSPRHVPDEVIAVPDVPRTLTGKILEVPVKKMLMGQKAARVASRDALANPNAFEWFVDFAHRNRSEGTESSLELPG